MGVLDEAIRNHLELRRRAGASEAELARAEAEALGPARRDPAADIFADEGPAAAAVATTVLDPVQAEESNRAHEHEPPHSPTMPFTMLSTATCISDRPFSASNVLRRPVTASAARSGEMSVISSPP